MSDLKVIDIYPKSIYTKIEISKDGVEHVLNFLDNSKCLYDSSKNPELEKAVMYIKNDFYPFLTNLMGALNNVS